MVCIACWGSCEWCLSEYKLVLAGAAVSGYERVGASGGHCCLSRPLAAALQGQLRVQRDVLPQGY